MRTCKECGEQIRGRSDKLFCSDQCRTHWHNIRNRDKNLTVRNINNTLRRNRRILQSLHAAKKKPSRSFMIGLGFQFDHFTGIQNTPDHSIYLCYDYGFHESGNGLFTIIRIATAGSDPLVISKNERQTVLAATNDDHFRVG